MTPLLAKYLQKTDKSEDSSPEELGCDAPQSVSVILLVERLIEQAFTLGASDIHIEPREEDVRVRLRIDGVLKDFDTFPKTVHCEVIARIKVLSGLRIDERRVAQDGRFSFKNAEDVCVDLRVSTAPTYHGENAVIRLLKDHDASFTLSALGFSAKDEKRIRKAIDKPNGMVLVTGPTGSGKTTTLYTLLTILNSPEASVVTIEDPIECALPNVKQMQVHNKSGFTFASGLRSILRQDPDVIMVGEIRDGETAGVAVNTALTGHLLLSTLHTNDAAATLPRLSDMGIDPYLVASTINVVIGQRLVRTICTDCKESFEVTEALEEALASLPLQKKIKKGETLSKGAGCEKCNQTGYRGRISINEVLVADEEIQEAVLRRVSGAELTRIAVKNGMTPMLEDGFKKVRSGVTTVEEILR